MAGQRYHSILPAFRGKTAYARLKHLGVPRTAIHAILRTCKSRLDAKENARRRELFVRAVGSGEIDIPADLGYVRFTDAEIATIPAALALCNSLVREHRLVHSPASHSLAPNKPYIDCLVSNAEFARYPEIVNLIADRRLLDAVARYLGTIPILATCELWRTSPSDSLRGSQLFHSDYEDRHQVKFFLNISDVESDQGPLTFFPRNVSTRLYSGLSKHRNRFHDRQFAQVPASDYVRLTGPAGSAALVDTSACLHFGSRTNHRERVVLMLQFLRFDAPCAAFNALWSRPSGAAASIGVRALETLDDVQRAVFGYRS